MLNLEIIQSSDSEALGIYQYYFPKVIIGTSRSCHIPLLDKKCSLYSVSLECIKEGLFLQNIGQRIYHVNEKKFSGKKLIHISDEFQIGDTIFKVREYQFDTILKNNFYQTSKNILFQDQERGHKFLESLENELLFIEYHFK